MKFDEDSTSMHLREVNFDDCLELSRSLSDSAPARVARTD